MWSRRTWLATAASALAALAIAPRSARAETMSAARDALTTSDVVYLTPLKSNGEESACKAEIWFVPDGDSIYLVTAATAWRARAIGQGLTRARVWVGEFGTWTDAKDAFRAAPMLETVGNAVSDQDAQARVLDLMGEKYRASWLMWGPRFRNGLADGSRVMLQYRIKT
ncbi:MAG: hypothetical protein HC809_07000 [Gammaproteobacteria bacterium]|nr:hypothetical protein [Gammaproteobacteria bacterium]